MSARANPTAIGLFMIGAIVATVVGVAVLASNTWFGDRTTFISFFGESVNGLDRGAPVKFQGVPVGTVTGLLIQIDQSDKTFQVPVQYEVDLTRLTSRSGTFVDLNDPQVLQEQIRDGLRAQLQMESLVTGQLYVELTYRDDPEPPQLAQGPTAFPEIPTTRSLLAAFGTEAGSLVDDVLDVLIRINEMLAEVDMKGINTAVVSAAQATEQLVGSEELRTAIGEIPEMTAQFGQAMDGLVQLMEQLSAEIEPLHSQLADTNDEVVLTLQTMRQAIEEMRGSLSTDSGVGYQMQQAMESLGDAAEALRSLAISLERNPDMLLRGLTPPQR
jgi:phospholipid/cholesterol/gamma-HCH transport system substrate-binding protein